MKISSVSLVAILLIMACAQNLRAEVGDPQVRTDHPYYPGELALSTFERLFATQAEQYTRITRAPPASEQEKALASWYFRNTHYFHGEEGAEDLWGSGFEKGGDLRTREYWTGLFAHGFGLCGTTHSQWTAEMNVLLGHARARGVGVQGHNSFEVFLNDRWALLDHDISTVVFDPAGKTLLSIKDIMPDLKNWMNRGHAPEKQNGWLVCGLHPDDGGVFSTFTTAEYLPGYAGVPPIVRLRRGETMRRYFEPGLEDGKTFVFWGRNYNTEGIPGPERSITWVNQPEKMRNSKDGAGFHPGQARYANAVYAYSPNFKNGDYLEGVIEETPRSVTFEFYTPYIIGATPPNSKEWGIYEAGCRNGLVIEGRGAAPVQISTDQGASWQDAGLLQGKLDLTDFTKGRRQYFLRFQTNAQSLAEAGVTIKTVCQAAVGILPRLKDNGSEITFQSGRRGVLSAGPNLPQAKKHIVAGAFNSPKVTLRLEAPRQAATAEIYAAAHIASGNPPDTNLKYRIDYSVDDGKTWSPIVADWNIPRRGEEPADFWSQSLCYGSVKIPPTLNPIQIRFQNSGSRNYIRAEAHLVYHTTSNDSAQVSFHWTDSDGPHTASKVVSADPNPATWALKTAQAVRTQWVEFKTLPAR